MKVQELVSKLSAPNFHDAFKELRGILYDSTKDQKLVVISELMKQEVREMNQVLAELVQIEEDPSVRMASFAALCKLGGREHFPVLLEVLQMEEVRMVRLVMRSNLSIFIMEKDISFDEVSRVSSGEPDLILRDPFSCNFCGESIWNYPCQVCGKGEYCSICYTEIKNLILRVQCPECHHSFHKEHIASWLSSSEGCPICRNPNIALKLS